MMTDNEFAACVYCGMYGLKEADSDIYVQGVLDAIKSLDDSYQQALECYYRKGMTYKQAGEKLGMSAASMNHIVLKAILQLRHPSRSRNIRVSTITGNLNQLLEIQNGTIDHLYQEIDNLIEGKPVSFDIEFRKKNVSQLGLTSKTENHLCRAGLQNVESLLALDSTAPLMKLYNFGKSNRRELITQMRKHGYEEWAKKMEAAI